jgi:hypothetical protein
MGEFSCNSRRSFLVCFLHHADAALALALTTAAFAAATFATAALAALAATFALAVAAASAALVPGRWRARHANIQSCWWLFGLPQTGLRRWFILFLRRSVWWQSINHISFAGG